MSQCSFEEPGSGNNCLLSSNPKAGQAKGQTGLCGRAWAQNLSFAVHDFGPQRDDRASADRWRGGGAKLGPWLINQNRMGLMSAVGGFCYASLQCIGWSGDRAPTAGCSRPNCSQWRAGRCPFVAGASLAGRPHLLLACWRSCYCCSPYSREAACHR